MGKMPKRKSIKPSVRWAVFARDGFCCRYCGARAGEEGVQLTADHVISVADGGDDSINNLITACQNCNGGKGARSLQELPSASDVAARMEERAASVARQAEAMRASLDRAKELDQEAVNLKCNAYDVKTVTVVPRELGMIIKLCREFGAETVLDWYRQACNRGVDEDQSIKYVCGIARNTRERAGV